MTEEEWQYHRRHAIRDHDTNAMVSVMRNGMVKIEGCSPMNVSEAEQILTKDMMRRLGLAK